MKKIETKLWHSLKELNLSYFALAIVFLFHLLNLMNQNFYSKYHVLAKELKLNVFGKEIFSIPFFGVYRSEKDGDFISKKTTAIGTLIKHHLNETNESLLFLQNNNVLRSYVRSELDLQYDLTSERIPTRFYSSMDRLIEKLSLSGVFVIIVPVPTKLSIERRQFSEQLPNINPWNKPVLALHENAKGFYQKIVEVSPKNVIDLFNYFESYLQNFPKDELFVPYGSHWSSLGEAVAAKAIVERLKEIGFVEAVPLVRSLKHEGVGSSFRFDFIPNLGERFLSANPGYTWQEKVFELTPVLRIESLGRVFLTGTSFSERLHDKSHNLASILGRSLNLQVIDLSFGGAGIFKSMARLKASDYALRPGDVLIWEFPVDLMIDLDGLSPDIPVPNVTDVKNP